jgi:hypothetical protein
MTLRAFVPSVIGRRHLCLRFLAASRRLRQYFFIAALIARFCDGFICSDGFICYLRVKAFFEQKNPRPFGPGNRNHCDDRINGATAPRQAI